MTPSSPRAGLNVGVILAPEFTLLALSGFIDALRLSADEGDRSRQIDCAWTIMSARAEPVSASCGLAVQPTAGFLAPERFDYVVVVGGVRRAGRPTPEPLLAYVRRAAEANIPLVGLCTGSFILAEAGVMGGRSACVSWFHHAEFAEAYPTLQARSDRLFLVDGNRITSPGGVSVIHLARHLIDRHLGPGRAREALRIMIEEGVRDGRDLQPVAGPPLPRDAPTTLRRALLLMETQLSAPLPLTALARRAGIGARQLSRQFVRYLGQPPARMLQTLRLVQARHMLRTTALPVTTIGLECGFAHAAHFARAYRAHWGVAPSGEIRDDGASTVEQRDRSGVRLAPDSRILRS